MACGIVAGMFALDVGDSQIPILRILAPVSGGSVLIGLVHVAGFCALSFFCFLLGVGLCSGLFATGKR